jgi:twitching motility protein PilT
MPDLNIEPHLNRLVEQSGSDLHLKADCPARIRVDGRLETISDLSIPSQRALDSDLEIMAPKAALETFRKTGEADFAYVNGSGHRFRVNVYLHQRKLALAFRRIKDRPPTVNELGLPEAIRALARLERGLVLVTGPTGSGKSSTLAAMVDQINSERSKHIITLEDPVEYMHSDKLSLINQREIGFDTRSFAAALRAALRQDPDVVLVGEMRDLETVQAALQAAETGHLVLSTLHTIGASETISRIIDLFPPHQQHQARLTVAEVLGGVVSQRLVPRRDGTGVAAACEVLVANGRIRQAILDPDHATDIATIIKEGEFYGMMSFDQHLLALVKSGVIDIEQALANASNPHDLSLDFKQLG